MAFLLAPLTAILIYAFWFTERRIRIRDTIVGYVVGVVLSGAVLGFLGMYLGAFILCAVIDGNCGFAGSLVGAPLGAAIGVGIFVYVWTRRHQHPNPALNTDAGSPPRAG